jgi:hypothetical protein
MEAERTLQPVWMLDMVAKRKRLLPFLGLETLQLCVLFGFL